MWAFRAICEGLKRAAGRLCLFSVIFPLLGCVTAASCPLPHRAPRVWRAFLSGRSSGVEHNLAKVGVGRSNRLARSISIWNTSAIGPEAIRADCAL